MDSKSLTRLVVDAREITKNLHMLVVNKGKLDNKILRLKWQMINGSTQYKTEQGIVDHFSGIYINAL